MSVVAILQARTSSSRLPQKVLRPILGKPMVQLQVERVQRSRMIDKLVIATSIESSDDLLEELCVELGVECYRGSLEDVLDRFYCAASAEKPDHVVRLTGDCPLIDHGVIDKVIEHHINVGADYTSNGNPPSFPDGLDVEVMKFDVLEKAWEKAILQSEREHVTPYIRKHENGFIVSNFESDIDLSMFRWTVDEPEDLDFVISIYSKLYNKNKDFMMLDILNLLELETELVGINNKFERNEGYLKSLKLDDHR